MRTIGVLLSALAVVRGADSSSLHATYAKLPLSFEADRGQTDPQVLFLSRGPGYTLFLTRTGAVMKLGDRAVLGMKLTGANPGARLEGLDRQAGNSNYFIGNDPAQWRTNVPNYAKVRVDDVYPGIDLVYYGNQRELEYDWIVKPGGDPSRIRFKIDGAEPRVDAAGDLVLETETGEVRQRKPVVYQGERRIEGGFVVRGHRVSFEVAAYDRSRPLVIDPVLVYSTYLGGTGGFINSGGGREGEIGYGIAVDGSGNAYITGQTHSTNFPTANALQPSPGGSVDAFVTKISANGSAMLYSTYLGGSGDDSGQGIAVDASGNAYVTGNTGSTNFPTANALQASFGGGTQYGPGDAFVTKISADGSTKLYSTYLGGSGDDGGSGIALDGSGNAYVTGQTNSTNFPTANPLQAANGGGSFPSGGVDAFVTKISADGSTKLYSTYLGGSGNDPAQGIAVDGSGNAYVTGYTDSTNFPTANALQGFIGGSSDAFVTKISADGSTKLYSTYLGGSSFDSGQGIAVDGSSKAYVTGYTGSTNFPTANPLQAAHGGYSDAFVTKISADGSTKLYSTYLGGSDLDQGQGIAVNKSGNAYVTGYTYSTNFPTAYPLQAANAGGGYGGVSSNSNNAFVSVISDNAPTPALGFFPITPCRAVDTRVGQNHTGAFGPPSLAAYASRDFPISSSSCGIPSTSHAYSLNMTVLPPGPLDFLSTWPAGQFYPNVSTLNSTDGSTLANAALVSSGTNGAITVVGGKPTDLIIDANGYFSPPNGSELVFYTLTPCRLVDTRVGQNKSGAFGPPSLAAYSSRDFPLLSGGCGIPNSAHAYSLNLTAITQGPLSFLSTWPAGQPYPNVSTLNATDGFTIANAAIVPMGNGGAITVVAGNPTDLVIDINGYFSPPGLPGGLHFYSVTPSRVVDTRVGQNKTGAFGPPSLAGYSSRDFPILSGGCGIPSTAQAYSLNMTALPPGPPEFPVHLAGGSALPERLDPELARRRHIGERRDRAGGNQWRDHRCRRQSNRSDH